MPVEDHHFPRECGKPPLVVVRGSGLCGPILRPFLYSLVITFVIFAGYQILEIWWLSDVDPRIIHLFRIVRAVVCSMIMSTVVGWMVVQSSPSFLGAAAAVTGDCLRQPRLTEDERIRTYAQWFIAMRWLAVVVSWVLILIVVKITKLLPGQAWWPLVLTVAVLAACNVGFTYLLRWRQGRPMLLLQAHLDLAILTLLLYFSGGVENPLSTMMIFHIIIGGILLTRGQCYGMAVSGTLLFALLIWAEYAGEAGRYAVEFFARIQENRGATLPLYAISRIFLQGGILFLTAYFVTTLAERMRHDERHLKALADQARAERQLLERALETTGTGLRLLKRDLEALWANNRWMEWSAPPTGETESGFDILDREDAPASKSLRDGQTRLTEVVLGTGAGASDSSRTPARRVFQVTTAPVVDADGKIIQIVELAQEITEQKKGQEQMLRAGKFAAIGELAGRVAHEVNNPIAIISAKANLLLSDWRSEMSLRIAQELVKINDLANRVARIAQGLLSYCRPSAAIRVGLDVRIPIRKSLAIMEHSAARNGVQVEDHLSDPIPAVKANANEMEQIFLNLFLNALDAMPNGGSLTVSSQPDTVVLPNGRAGVAVIVEDTGRGIPRELQERIFEPFFTTKQDGRGTGLGLSICLGLVRSHGGELEVQSEVGTGCRFTIMLPACDQDRKESYP